MFKKPVVLTLAIIFLMVFTSAALAVPVGVIIEGPQDEYPRYLELKIPASIENGHTLIPLRTVAETLGFKVKWHADSRKIIVHGNQQVIEMQIGNNQALVNGDSIKINPAPYLLMNTTIVPLRFLAESLGYSVAYSDFWHEKQVDVYVTPYTLISDAEIAQINQTNFKEIPCIEPGPGGNTYYILKKSGITPGGIRLGASIQEVLKVYGVPRAPQRSWQYARDWSGVLNYWGTFIPQSGSGTWIDFEFRKGRLVNMSINR